jgi:hypothetical protein
MRTKTLVTVSVALVVLPIASPLWAGWEGTLKLGGIVLEEEGDLSTVQETFNIHDGFSISRIRLAGSSNPDNYLMLDLKEINLDGRQGSFLYRRPGMLRLTASFDQHRQVFDPRRGVNSERKDWKFGARLTPVEWLRLSGAFNYMDRNGERLAYPAGTGSVLGTETASALGTGYDYSMRTGQLGAEVRKDRRGVALDYRMTDFTDDLNIDADRTGNVVSARAFTPGPLFPDKVTHLLRAAYGVSELSGREVDYTLIGFRYTGVVRPVTELQLKYGFDAQRVDHETTDLKTDRFQHNLDATFHHRDGSVFGGYSYETNDDDSHLTSYNSWRAGASLRGDRHTARIRYSGREKKDTEELTLLKDVEASRFLADLEVKPLDDLTLGLGLNVRDREFPDIGVESKGRVLRANAGWAYPGWGRLSGTYSYTQDEFTDLAAGYDVNSHVVTARADLERIKNTRLSGGVTYLDIGKDLDIEKSILFVEGEYTVAKDYHFEVKYNVYNYDDYVLLDRYYTANVVWFNVAYDIHVE